MILATIVEIAAVTIGLIFLARWELNRQCVRWRAASGHRICAEYR